MSCGRWLPFVSLVPFVVYMDRISRCNQVGGWEGGLRFGDLRIPSLLFADEVVLLALSCLDPQFS